MAVPRLGMPLIGIGLPMPESGPRSRTIKTIAIIGGGPAGASLAALLARQGYKAAIFHTHKRPPIIVGESLLPAVVPMLRNLGIEDEVKSFSVFKPGATVCLGMREVISAVFTWANGKMPPYAYNTPRNLFDQAVLNAAERAGAKIFKATAKLEKGEQPDTVRLSKETMDATDGFFGAPPDLIVDATGRARLISRLLDIPLRKGGRDDVALFAHLDKAFINDAGHIHVDHLAKGWGWRIPLPGKVSLGVVIHPKHLEKYGNRIEDQFDGYIREEPSLKVYFEGASRVTPVVKYNNYQIVPGKMYGPGWVMIGDAAGFLDPVFSTGVYLGMKDAFELFKAIENGSSHAMQRYEDRRHVELKLWQMIINDWYNGKLFNLYRVGQQYKNNPIGAGISRHFQQRLGRIFSGEAAGDGFGVKMVDYLSSFGVLMRDPKDIEIV